LSLQDPGGENEVRIGEAKKAEKKDLKGREGEREKEGGRAEIVLSSQQSLPAPPPFLLLLLRFLPFVELLLQILVRPKMSPSGSQVSLHLQSPNQLQTRPLKLTPPLPQLHPPSLRRHLPWDILLSIFKEADPSTLAALGRVSFDFLASTSSLLYREVEVKSVEELEMLFCERKGRRSTKVSRLSSSSGCGGPL